MIWDEAESLLRRAGAVGPGLREMRRRWHATCPECRGTGESLVIVAERVAAGAHILTSMGWQVCAECGGRGWRT